ncbi:hypothetical protein ACFQ9X_22615 [Catenulispora yoronensis]
MQIASPVEAGVLPVGSRVVALPDKQQVRVRSAHGSYTVQIAERDLGDPLLGGLYQRIGGGRLGVWVR